MTATALKESFSFELNAVPPYSFELTVHKPAGWWWSTPNETYENGTLWSATRIDKTPFGLKLQSLGTAVKPKVCCTAFSAKKATEETKAQIKHTLQRALQTSEDLSEFYSLAQKDCVLCDAAADLCGMHAVGWPELFPAMILAATLQMAPMKRSNQMMDSLIENFGTKLCFDGKTIHYWPSTKKISDTPITVLQKRAKLGYRAANLVSIAQTLEAGFPTMDELHDMEPEKARKTLFGLRGIGGYSAELVMLEAGFPLDSWSAKIFGVLFFGKVPDDPREAISALREEAQKRWGKWMGYAFVYVLNDLPQLSKRVGFDLTQF